MYEREQSPQGFESRFEFGSSLPLFVIVEKLPELREFFFRRFARRKGADQQTLHRPVEAPLQQITGKLLLNQFAWMGGGVHMSTIRLVTLEQSLLCHDLHELQHSRILRGLPLPPQRLIHVTDGTRTA